MNLAVEFKGISKAFDQVRANSDLCLSVKKGSIHAIIGENGAGKSTAMKILYGIYPPDEGDIYVDGKLWGGKESWSSPSDAISCGIGMVHQHFMLGGPYSVLDNILLGVETARKGWRWLPPALRPMDKISAKKKLDQISDQFGLHVDWHARVESLSVGVQQRIEILKLLYRDAKILILDEPTAVLTPQETVELFGYLRKLADQGKTVIIITHKLKEVMSLADRVTVFRAGHVVGEREIQATDVEDLATLMVGRKVNLKGEAPTSSVSDQPVLELKNVSVGEGKHRLQNLNFKVHSGEIVGISGVEGNGQSDLIQLLMHPKSHFTQLKGTIRLLGNDVEHLTSREVKDLGMGVIPDDRHRDGLILDWPVSDNFLLALQRRKPFYRYGLISSEKLEKATARVLEAYDIRPRSTKLPISALSGGNQQKLVIAREFEYSPRFLIAAQPTRGVDVGAIEFIHKKILDARSRGSGVLLISSELDEILALSDRILVMYEGKIVAEFKRGEVNEKALGLRMGGEAHV